MRASPTELAKAAKASLRGRLNNRRMWIVFLAFGFVMTILLLFFMTMDTPPGVAVEVRDEPKFPIDVVITWVDGEDETWQEGFRNASLRVTGNVDVDRVPNSDYVHDELYYNLRGLSNNMPWIRQVFIVTQRPQIPNHLEELREHALFPIKIVHHDEFIPAKYLPTYASSVIEMFFDQIPGLADHFVYFNDDMFVTRPLQPHQFFTPCGQAIVPTQYYDESWFICAFMGKQHSCRKQFARKLLGKWFMRSRLHIPYAFTKESFAALRERLGQDVVDEMCSHSVRTVHSIPTPYTVPNIGGSHVKLVYSAPYSFAFYHQMFHVRLFPWQKPHMTQADVVCINLLNPSTSKKVTDVLYSQLRDWIIPKAEQADFVL